MRGAGREQCKRGGKKSPLLVRRGNEKKYASPVLTYLDFLRLEEAPKVTAREE